MLICGPKYITLADHHYFNKGETFIMIDNFIMKFDRQHPHRHSCMDTVERGHGLFFYASMRDKVALCEEISDLEEWE
jgi:hypothetical protein